MKIVRVRLRSLRGAGAVVALGATSLALWLAPGAAPAQHGAAPAEQAARAQQGSTTLRPPSAFAGITDPAQRSAGLFVEAGKVLQHPRCAVRDGRIEQTNFHAYESMRLQQMPKVESIIMPSGGFWGGVGEPTICVAAPAVLNAYFAATGTRLRTVPLKRHGLTLA